MVHLIEMCSSTRKLNSLQSSGLWWPFWQLTGQMWSMGYFHPSVSEDNRKVLAKEMLHFLCLWNKGNCGCQGCVVDVNRTRAMPHPVQSRPSNVWSICACCGWKASSNLQSATWGWIVLKLSDCHLPSTGHELPWIVPALSWGTVWDRV